MNASDGEGNALVYRCALYAESVEKLMRFTKNGTIEMENSLVEIRIRPVALGRKNNLVAGSHAAV